MLSGPGLMPAEETIRGYGASSSREACCQDHHHSTPNPNFSPQPVTEAPEQPKVTANRKTARPKKPHPQSTAVTKPAAGN